ncbi:hypothetical protein DS884_07900 [Tenacibaculum sp. E3R01]|uniref:hypothetical protein n=1 Tax=Tenacibaculum sp. E3R01 TaxID=2267227 RepID=UPI000DE9D05B|nr:hypothetical protein [Tenacibaculum sp. E3R01]RBW59647.1 hypothetical protein DS884_07900 [Tenacibaculum sp. E3R01]
MKYIKVLILGLFSFTLFAQDLPTNKRIFVQKFMKDMKQMESLNKYVKNSSDYTIDFFNVSKYKIVSIVKNKAVVDIDTGKGKYCIRIYLTLIEDKKSKIILLKGYKNEDIDFLDPWYKIERICP